jgi:hypothetical protein
MRHTAVVVARVNVNGCGAVIQMRADLPQLSALRLVVAAVQAGVAGAAVVQAALEAAALGLLRRLRLQRPRSMQTRSV